MKRRSNQLELPRSSGWGGHREGAGRKSSDPRPGPQHIPRLSHEARHPVHVTLRARTGLASLRGAGVFPTLRRALARASRASFRVVHFSVQSDHVHLLVEADSREILIRGVQGLAVRCARAFNRAARRRGAVWSHRYHSRALATPSEVRRGLVYVLLNHRKHLRAGAGVDPCSSGPWFEGWSERPYRPSAASPVPSSRTWLGATGWFRAGGLISLRESPARRE